MAQLFGGAPKLPAQVKAPDRESPEAMEERRRRLAEMAASQGRSGTNTVPAAVGTNTKMGQ